jgi:hypothetical protein
MGLANYLAEKGLEKRHLGLYLASQEGEFFENMRKMKTISCKSSFAVAGRCAALAIAVVLTLLGRAEGAIFIAASINEADVWAAAIQCNTNGGDTVLIPAGSNAWTTNMHITWPMTFQGAGVDQTIIGDNNTNNLVSPGYNESILNFWNTQNTNALKRITGITFVNASTNNPNAFYQGAIQFYETNNDGMHMVDHCSFTNLADNDMIWSGSAYGLIDHCYSTKTYPNTTDFFISIFLPNWNHDAYQSGDQSFMAPSGLGTSNAVYIENCVFYNPAVTNAQDSYVWTVTDSWQGGRFCFRYNFCTNCSIACHGTESSALYRGCRLAEIYNNTFIDSNQFANIFQYRGGTGVVFSNMAYGFGALVTMDQYRCENYVPNFWLGAQGTNGWDLQTSTNALFVVTNLSTNSVTLIASNVSWTPNQYIGYSVIDDNVTPTGATGNFNIIVSNTANTAYFQNGLFVNLIFNPGDICEFHKITAVLDMPGMGFCTNQIGRVSTANPTPTNATWPGQSIEPIYCWGNTLSGSANGSSPTVGTLVANIGILTNGVHYFNTVMPGYVPFTYPHPLSLIGTNLYPPLNPRVAPGP